MKGDEQYSTIEWEVDDVSSSDVSLYHDDDDDESKLVPKDKKTHKSLIT